MSFVTTLIELKVVKCNSCDTKTKGIQTAYDDGTGVLDAVPPSPDPQLWDAEAGE